MAGGVGQWKVRLRSHAIWQKIKAARISAFPVEQNLSPSHCCSAASLLHSPFWRFLPRLRPPLVGGLLFCTCSGKEHCLEERTPKSIKPFRRWAIHRSPQDRTPSPSTSGVRCLRPQIRDVQPKLRCNRLRKRTRITTGAFGPASSQCDAAAKFHQEALVLRGAEILLIQSDELVSVLGYNEAVRNGRLHGW